MSSIPSWVQIDKLLKKKFVIEFYEEKELTALGSCMISGLSDYDFIQLIKTLQKQFEVEINIIKESKNSADFIGEIKYINNRLIKYQKNLNLIQALKKKYPYKVVNRGIKEHEDYVPEVNYTVINCITKYTNFINLLSGLVNDNLKFILKQVGKVIRFNIKIEENRPALKRIHTELVRNNKYLDCSINQFLRALSNKRKNEVLDWKETQGSLKYFVQKLASHFKEVPGNIIIITVSTFTVKGEELGADRLNDNKYISKKHVQFIDSVFKNLP
jgi:hypothetical protein